MGDSMRRGFCSYGAASGVGSAVWEADDVRPPALDTQSEALAEAVRRGLRRLLEP